MALGPVDVVALAFPGAHIHRDIVPALAAATGSGAIRIVDVLFVEKGADGTLQTSELSLAESDLALALDPLADEVLGLFAEEDVAKLDAILEPNTVVLVVVFEQAWAVRLAEATVAAQGRVLAQLHIAAEVASAVSRARSAASPGDEGGAGEQPPADRGGA